MAPSLGSTDTMETPSLFEAGLSPSYGMVFAAVTAAFCHFGLMVVWIS